MTGFRAGIEGEGPEALVYMVDVTLIASWGSSLLIN